MTLPDARSEIADACNTIAQTVRYRRLWRAIRVAMMVMLSAFLALLLFYTVLAIAYGAGAWHWSFLLVGDGFLVFLLVTVARHRGIERMFDAEVAKATQDLRAAGYRPVMRGGRVLIAPLDAPDEAAAEMKAA